MRHLITGGAGFIGSHLTELLVMRGDSVVVLDDLSTGARSNIEPLLATGRVTLVEGSILDPLVVDDLVREVDDVYHLAAAVGVQLVVEKPVSSIVTNTVGTEHVLRSAARHHRPTLITSSSEVYGYSDAVPFREEAGVTLGPTTRVRWGYGCTKALDEFLAFAYAQEHSLQVVVARLFNTVGPRQTGRYGMVVPRFVRQALANEPITVFGDGTQTRCFAWVGDVVSAFPKLLAEKRAWSNVVNIGSTEEISVLSLAERVRVRTGSRSTISLVPFVDVFGDRFDDMQRRVPSIDRARSLIGYSPTLGIDAILDQVIAAQRQTPVATVSRAAS
jgi:UDP-glucose 4-epimerase